MSLASGKGLAAITSGSGAVAASTAPWIFIGKTTISSTVTNVELDVSGDYTTYKLIGDRIEGQSTNHLYIRYMIDGTENTSGYGYGVYYANTGATFTYGGNSDRISLTQNNTDWPKTFDFVFTTASSNGRPVYRWTYGSGTSTYDPTFAIGGGQHNVNLQTSITGVRVYANTSNLIGGTFKLYGSNKHD